MDDKKFQDCDIAVQYIDKTGSMLVIRKDDGLLGDFKAGDEVSILHLSTRLYNLKAPADVLWIPYEEPRDLKFTEQELQLLRDALGEFIDTSRSPHEMKDANALLLKLRNR